jgi:hypothetical protein
LVGILVSNEDAGLVVDPSQQHEFIGEPKAIQESGLDIAAFVRGVVKPEECPVAQRLKQHPHWELLSACWVDPSVHQATLLAGCQAERWNSQ